MQLPFAFLDWLLFALYGALMLAVAWYFSRQSAHNNSEFFLAGNAMPVWMVAISTLATTQSAATFLGGPDLGYRSDLSYLFTNLGAVIAALVVARWLIPRFYALRVTTVYELLESRFTANAKRQAAGMYLLGRLFASGARLFMAALAVSMMLFADIEPGHMLLAIGLLVAISLVQTIFSGVSSVIQTDVIQCAVYVSAALAVLAVLVTQIDASPAEVWQALASPADGGASKLTLLDTGWDWQDPFNLWATLTGFVLLNIAAFGLDQDVTQRVLTCKNANEGARAMLFSVLLVIPVMALFMIIGLLLYIVFQRPDLMGGAAMSAPTTGDVTVFMHYVLNGLPAGVRGLVIIGVMAAALSTLTSSLNSMASVITEDFYRPWAEARGQRSDAHYLQAGRLAMLATGLALGAMAALCYGWQRVSDLPLLAFALSVMVFAYSGLLGVFLTAVFTSRGNPTSVWLALVAGFVITLVQQPWVISWLALDAWYTSPSFTWQLCVGAGLSFIICCLGRPHTEPHAALEASS
ncbi:sodium:solute symporter [Simiduia agarivorans]|uniref:Na+/solute symporter n=1 Tax=Simiduia agarivorans (strain DSM 21679 / JCM 13881 / BCRC 17597 / SA1) TaxID=1117647 RepID=K4KXR3_SIMAS|nr:sodium:solute symporter [Simiduia agarivorans]AFU98697.1 Na+/solute symporter [Simiduia agarivorans SA1 = DSM 21679]